MLICGIDENGRGAVIGPLVITGVVVDKNDISKLKEIGVRDSKQLTKEKREKLYKKIEDIAEEIIVLRVFPDRIDKLRKNGVNLNEIEAMKTAEIINYSNADVYYIDSLTTRPEKYREKIKKYVTRKPMPKLIVKNYLDESNPVVSAASVIGKVERDKEIVKIAKKENLETGVGYPHDKKTREFLRRVYKKYHRYPNYVRKTWVTAKEIKKELKIKSLKDYFHK